MKSSLLIALLGAVSLSACAQSTTATDQSSKTAASASTSKEMEGKVRAALNGLNSQIKVEYIGAAPFPGFREVIASGQVVYVSDDGKYLLQGSVLDIANRKSVSENSPALIQYRADLLKSIPAADRIVFAPPNPAYTVSIFTDVECGYCRKLHSEIAEYNKQGIAVEYMAFPRMGLGTKDSKSMVSVWCSANRQQALTDAKAGKAVADKDCKNPVETEFNLGQKLGISGTPAVFTASGNQIGGYLPPAQMRAVLDQLAGKKPATAAAATTGGMK